MFRTLLSVLLLHTPVSVRRVPYRSAGKTGPQKHHPWLSSVVSGRGCEWRVTIRVSTAHLYSYDTSRITLGACNRPQNIPQH
ncbi:uncharacterized protein P884DRAFT_29563 [Thermothelomyces heterothallicus CBS 202.75]|uniref:uncharacterized protein n=1 Tax=Thermothelomyces heterothallicus CBS 202.75 TaxID=1149848 RepID=UPI003743DB87